LNFEIQAPWSRKPTLLRVCHVVVEKVEVLEKATDVGALWYQKKNVSWQGSVGETCKLEKMDFCDG